MKRVAIALFTAILLCVAVLPAQVFADTSGNVSVQVSLLYDDIYYEQYLKYGQPLTIKAAIQNDMDSTKNVILYTALCDAKGIVTALEQEPAAVQAGQSAVLSASMTAQSGESIRVMVWDQDTQRPLYQEDKLSSFQRDLFGDTIGEAAEVDFTKMIKGRINDVSDVDCVKIIPDKTAEYIISAYSTTNLIGELYNAAQEKMADGASGCFAVFFIGTVYSRIHIGGDL